MSCRTGNIMRNSLIFAFPILFYKACKYSLHDTCEASKHSYVQQTDLLFFLSLRNCLEVCADFFSRSSGGTQLVGLPSKPWLISVPGCF